MFRTPPRRHAGLALLILALLIVAMIYQPGLHGGWLFDDYPNIVDNKGVQPSTISFASLVNAALSSPASEFKRPLASLSFASNYLATGLDPFWMKLINLLIHLLNGALVFALTGILLRSLPPAQPACDGSGAPAEQSRTGCAPTSDDSSSRASIVAALIAAGWLLLPINLTAVLYVVQRMESMANGFVLLGLIGYVAGRQRMLAMVFATSSASHDASGHIRSSSNTKSFILCLLSITVPTAAGMLAKETAVMLPLYALLVEWMLFRFRASSGIAWHRTSGLLEETRPSRDGRILTLFTLVLALPMVIGLGWQLPGLLNPATWATRDFTLGTRLLSETRIVVDYIGWTLLPLPSALSFYHDDFVASSSLFTPWSTLASALALIALTALMCWLRKRQPLTALGIALFLGCHLLTGTVLPLELIYEHRNYFASYGLLLAIAPPLLAITPPTRTAVFALPRRALYACLLLWWATSTAITAHAWGNPLTLAKELAEHAPESPRAQYELGRTYIIYSHYDPHSPFTRLAYAPLERAAALPKSSVLPQQALIFMNSRMGLPLKEAWWETMIAKLRAHTPDVQDESSITVLAQCAKDRNCNLPTDRMTQVFTAALNHPHPTARLYAAYGDYAWSVLKNQELGERMTEAAVEGNPTEPAYRITLTRMLIAMGRHDEAYKTLKQLETLNVGGRLDSSITELKASMNRTWGA